MALLLSIAASREGDDGDGEAGGWVIGVVVDDRDQGRWICDGWVGRATRVSQDVRAQTPYEPHRRPNCGASAQDPTLRCMRLQSVPRAAGYRMLNGFSCTHFWASAFFGEMLSARGVGIGIPTTPAHGPSG